MVSFCFFWDFCLFCLFYLRFFLLFSFFLFFLFFLNLFLKNCSMQDKQTADIKVSCVDILRVSNRKETERNMTKCHRFLMHCEWFQCLHANQEINRRVFVE